MGTKAENNKPVVLMVDDQREIRELAKNHFEMIHGYHVITAATFWTAIKVIHGTRKMIVAFVDVNLRGEKSGLDLLRYIREYASHRVVPFGFTGEDSLIVEQKAVEAGAILVFKKNDPEVWDRMLIYTEGEQVVRLVRGRAEDPITGLEDFGTFCKSAVAEMKNAKNRMSKKNPKGFSLLFLDMDDFKKINDTYGNLVGDQVLRGVANAIRTHVRPNDHTSRKGGDEFVVWLSGIGKREAARVARKLKSVIDSIVISLPDGRDVRFSVSVGTSSIRIRDIGEDADKVLRDLIEQANRKEIQAKPAKASQPPTLLFEP